MTLMEKKGSIKRCVCGKAAFSSSGRAMSHARKLHSERMRVYLCDVSSDYHLTNNEKGTQIRDMTKTKTRRRVDTRKDRYKSKRTLASYVRGDE